MSDLTKRILARDPTVWVDDPATPEVADRLGWLDVRDTMPPHLDRVRAVAESVRGAGRVILAGMGGSSLAPEVLWRTFGRQPGRPAPRLWDSTHPGAVPTLRDDDVFLIASKSGTTIETACFEDWAWDATGQDGDRFLAITDPGTALARRARERGYRAVFENPSDIGGRFSALSLFGLVPATLLGFDPERLLAASAIDFAPWEALGRTIGGAALAGQNRLAVTAPDAFASFGLWLEQLVAESTGKGGAGIVPVPPEVADDRTFQHTIVPGDPHDLGTQFMGWEFATAVMGHVLRVNPFDQPDVEEAKVRTRALIARGKVEMGKGGTREVRQLLDGVAPPEYLALLVYDAPTAEGETRLADLQRRVRARTGVATTVAWGPRYLHSSGQLHKGGPAGRFILVTPPITEDVAIPGRDLTFGQLCAAQSAGDAEALAARGRPVVRVPSLDLLEEVL